MKDNELTSRELRHKRRIRSQIIAYSVLAVLIFGVLSAVYFGSQGLVKSLKKYNQKVNDALDAAESNVADELGESEDSDNSSNSGYTYDLSDNEALNELVASLVQEMTLEEKVAGLFIVSPESITGVSTAVQAGDGTKKALEENPVGGLIYDKKNYQSDEQFADMLTKTKTYAKFPMFLAVSQECGADAGFGVEATPSAMELTDTASVESAYTAIAQKLVSEGINMNLAPVSVVVSDDSGSAFVGRSFGSDAMTAAPLVNSAVRAMQNVELNAVLNKFPGANVQNKSLEELNNSDFAIYQTAISGGVDCIMVSSEKVSGITGDETPGTLSSVLISDVLRNQLGFTGVVITDKLNSAEITERYDSAQAAVAAIQAGADMILEPADYKQAYEAVLQAVSDGSIQESQIDESIYRIYRVKYKNALNE